LLVNMTKQMKAQREVGKTLPRGANGRFVTMKPRTPTVAARFSDSLQQLLQSMAKCNPWFVRCVKPNNDKQALRMDMPCVLQQLRYLGMLDTIRIRKMGYPVRLRFQHFVERYRHLLKAPLPRGTPYRELCRFVLETLPHTNAEGPDFQLGATRVFLREALHRVLEGSRADRLRNAAVVIQKHARGMLSRKKLQRQKKSAVKVQSAWRGHRQSKYYRELKVGVIKAQALYRGRLQRKRFAKMKIDMRRKKDMEKVQKERAQQRLAKETTERAPPVVHLDVPAELAFIFSKIDGWQPTHGDRHLVKVVGTVPGPPTAADFPGDIDQFAFGKFSSVYCNGVKLGPRREPISSPFLSRAAARDQDFQDALAIFKLILRWTGDKSLDGTTKEKILADYIVHKGLQSRGLRDEILVQLCNQSFKADEANANRIWQLMAHCLSCFQPGPAFNKYLIKFVSDNAPAQIREILLKKILRGGPPNQIAPNRIFPPSWLEWKSCHRMTDIALGLTLPDGVMQTVAVDSWTTCEEAAALAVSSLGIGTSGWTVVLNDQGQITDSCGLDLVLDLVAEKELCPAFPTIRSDLLRCGRKNSQMAVIADIEPSSPKRPQVPPPEPPGANKNRHSTSEAPVIPESISPIGGHSMMHDQSVREEIRIEYHRNPESQLHRKKSHDLLSRNSALNERYFEAEKSRSRSLDDLLASDTCEIIPVPEIQPLSNLGLSESRLNERYHSVERLAPLRETGPRYVKSQFAGKRSAGSHSSKYMDRHELGLGGGGVRSSAMSDTSEAPSLASHVRRVRVPSQASDVDQFLDDLFSPVLDGDELSDARSLAASIRGGGTTVSDFMEAPMLDNDLQTLSDAYSLSGTIKGGGDGNEMKPSRNSASALDKEVASINDIVVEESLDEYITDLFQPIFINDSIKTLTEKRELVEALKGGGTTHQHKTSTANGFSASKGMKSSSLSQFSPSQLLMMGTMGTEVIVPPGVPDPTGYQQHMQRAFLQSAMQQNIQIQQQLIAQNQALQTLLSQQAKGTPTSSATPSPIHNQTSPESKQQTSYKYRSESSSTFNDIMKNRKISADSGGSSLIPPPPPPPMPPPLDMKDPLETRPFLDPYGRAKTVRIGKWRWPPPQDGMVGENGENFIHFKMRQNQRKTTPQSMHNNSSSSNGSGGAIEWDEFEIEHQQNQMNGMEHSGMMNSSITTVTTKTNIKSESHSHNKSSSSAASANTSAAMAGQQARVHKRSFDVGAERPSPGSVGKLKLSSEMRQRLEQVTAGHSIRSSTSTKSDRLERAPNKLEDTRRLMLEQQLSGSMMAAHMRSNSSDIPSVKSKVQKMEGSKRPPPPPWPAVLPPAPQHQPPPPPVRPGLPPNSVPPAPPAPVTPYSGQQQQEIPSFLQRQERDTFGVKDHYNDSWGRVEAAKLDMVYESGKIALKN
jgi:myosin XV